MTQFSAGGVNRLAHFFNSAETQFHKVINSLTEKELEDISNHSSWYASKLSALINKQDTEIILKEMFMYLSSEVYDYITEYTKVFNFIPKEPDPAKIIYWIVYILYKDGTLKNMNIIRRLLEKMGDNQRDKNKIQKIVSETQILRKLLMYSEKGNSNFSLVYGEKSLSGYQLYKLTHEAIYIELPHLK